MVNMDTFVVHVYPAYVVGPCCSGTVGYANKKYQVTEQLYSRLLLDIVVLSEQLEW